MSEYKLRSRTVKRADNIPRATKKRKKQPPLIPQSECVICLQPVCRQTNRAVLSCGHEFHAECFTTWIAKSEKANCPTCRRRVGQCGNDSQPVLPMLYTDPYEDESADLGSQLPVNSGEDVEMYMEAHWDACFGKILSSGDDKNKESLDLWKKVIYHHRTFVELAYEMPSEIPRSDEQGDIEFFLEEFRGVLVNAMGALPSPWRGLGILTRADRAFQETETVWLMNIIGTSHSSVGGVCLGARLQMLVQGMAYNIVSDDRHMSSLDLKRQIRARPYSYMCSGAANRLHQLGKFRVHSF